MAITKKIITAKDYLAEAYRRRDTAGKTDLFSSGYPALDEYLGGGYGHEGDYEIVVLFGPTKIGKSFFALNLVTQPIANGKRVGLMMLEDDAAEVVRRLMEMGGPDMTRDYLAKGDTVHLIPQEAMDKMWKLDELLELIQEWFVERNLDVIVLDHLQFAFENAEAIKGENEYVAQRVFMKKLNVLMRKLKKTIILVSHVSKSTASKGADKVVGSGAIVQASTKILGLMPAKGDPETIELTMSGSRFTKTPHHPLRFKYDEVMKIKDVFDV